MRYLEDAEFVRSIGENNSSLVRGGRHGDDDVAALPHETSCGSATWIGVPEWQT